jgi:5-formyltetrahydrofolate cyclo-ligase
MPTPQDDQQAAWRKARRKALLEQRMALDKETLVRWGEAIDRHIERGFPGLFRSKAGSAEARVTASPSHPPVVAVCWPHRNEYDAGNIASKLRKNGSIVTLPVVISSSSALIFRKWTATTELARDRLGIAYPASGEALRPTVIFLPVVGFDLHGHRLGYGGGYFDRTLAELSATGKMPVVIGVGYEFSKLPTIHPAAHDMPMDFVVTEAGIYRRSPGVDMDAVLEFLGAPPAGEPSALSSPVCYASEIDPAYFGGKS